MVEKLKHWSATIRYLKGYIEKDELSFPKIDHLEERDDGSILVCLDGGAIEFIVGPSGVKVRADRRVIEHELEDDNV